MNRGMANMLITDILNGAGSECDTAIVEVEHRDDILKELEFQQSPYVDPSTRVQRDFVIGDVEVKGTLKNRRAPLPAPQKLDYDVRLIDKKTGKEVGRVQGSMDASDVFAGEEALAKQLNEELCKLSDVYEVRLDVVNSSAFATHVAGGRPLVRPEREAQRQEGARLARPGHPAVAGPHVHLEDRVLVHRPDRTGDPVERDADRPGRRPAQGGLGTDRERHGDRERQVPGQSRQPAAAADRRTARRRPHLRRSLRLHLPLRGRHPEDRGRRHRRRRRLDEQRHDDHHARGRGADGLTRGRWRPGAPSRSPAHSSTEDPMPAPLLSRLLAAAVSLVAMLAAPAGAAALPSDLVSAFGDDGLVSFDPRPGTTAGSFDPQAVHVLADGRTLLAGQDTKRGHHRRAPAARRRAGPVVRDIRADDHPCRRRHVRRGRRARRRHDGRILIGGRMENDAFVLRLTADGQRDATFDGDGLLPVTDPGGFGQFSDIAADGAGFYVIRSGYPARVYRYTAAGVLDEGFGLGGVSTGPADMNDTKLALDALRRIVVAGSITGSGYRVYRLQGMSDPSPGFYDATFTAVPIDLTGVTYSGAFRDVAVDGTDNVHLVGDPSTDGYEFVRISSAGTVGLPVASAAGPGGSDSPGAIAVLGGSVVVAGQTATGGFVELRSTTTGALVGSFNGGAAYTFACGSGSFCPVGALTTSGAQITLATEEPDDTARVVRLSASGAPDTSFSGDGFDSVEQRVPWGNDVLDSVATADGSLYVLGSAGAYNDESTYIAKRLPTGVPTPRSAPAACSSPTCGRRARNTCRRSRSTAPGGSSSSAATRRPTSGGSRRPASTGASGPGGRSASRSPGPTRSPARR